VNDKKFPLASENIPNLLKGLNRWISWKAGKAKPNGKFDKVPIDPTTGRNVDGTDPAKHMSFADAHAAYMAGRCSGIGIALTDEPVSTWGNVLCGAPQYLVALDLDGCVDSLVQVKALWKELGSIYIEASPSGNGVRMFALSRVLIRGGNAGNGRELYSTGRFMTVTGQAGRGKVVDATDPLCALASEWFKCKSERPFALGLIGKPPTSQSTRKILAHLVPGYLPEVSESIVRVRAQLDSIDADCSYETWRNVIWSLLSTGWSCAEEMARSWSQTATDRYEEKAFNAVVNSYVPTRGITLGTLTYHAKLAGWLPQAETLQQLTPELRSRCLPNEIHLKLISAIELKRRPPLQWVVKGLLPSKGLAAIYGQSGSGKTFVALHMAFALAEGVEHWFGLKIVATPVAYVALEGTGGLRQRIQALEAQHSRAAPSRIRFLLGDFTLLEGRHVTELAAEIQATFGAGAIVFVDTLNQSAAGADENSSVDMGIVVSNAKALAAAVDGMVVLVHHSGKDQGKGMRGHSSLHAAMDSIIEVVATANGRAWRVTKSKDGESGASHGFELVPYAVGQDGDGDEIRSCAVRPVILNTSNARKAPSGKNQKAALQILTALSRDHPHGYALSEAVRVVSGILSGADSRKTSRAKEAIDGLVASGHLALTDGSITIT